MVVIVTRAGKGSPLTHTEVDQNWLNINAGKVETAGFDAAVAATPAVTANTAKVTNATHTGDATGATALTLATVNANVGSFGTATQVATFTVNAKGLTTAAANVSISIPMTAISDSTAAGRAVLGAASATAQTALFDVFTSGAKGLAPASGGGTTNFLRADGTWAAPSGGGGGAPGGSNGEVQYNNGGAFAGAADVEIEGGQLRLPAIATPTAPAADGLKLFGRKVGGRMMPAFMSPSGLDSSLQPSFARNKMGLFMPAGNGGADTQLGLAVSATGTATAEIVATTNLHTYMRRRSWRVTVASTTAVAGIRGAALQWTLGGPAAGLGGFHMVWRWGPATGVATATHRAFVGMRNLTAAATDQNPSTLTNLFGMGYDSADANIQFMHNDGTGTATKIDLGGSFPKPNADVTSVYEIALFSPPGTTQTLHYEVTDLVSGAVATGTITTDVPTTATLLTPYSYMSVGGTSSVIGFATMGLYIESDY